jgi:hypothetical protein
MDRAISINVNARKRCTAEVTRSTQNHNRGFDASARESFGVEALKRSGIEADHALPAVTAAQTVVPCEYFNVLTNHATARSR